MTRTQTTTSRITNLRAAAYQMTSDNSTADFDFRKIFTIIVKLLLVLIVFYFIYLQLETNWNDIKNYDWSINSFGFLILSLACALAALFIFSATWSMIVRGFGDRLSLPVAFKISYLSNLGRYIPGKIWQLFGIIYIARQYGLSAEKSTASFIISQLFMSTSSLLILAVSVQLQPLIIVEQIGFLGNRFVFLFTAGMVIVSLAIIIWPNRILKIGNFVLRKLGRPELTFSIDKKVASAVFVGYCVAWIFYGVAFWLFIRSIIPSAGIDVVSAVGIFAGAYQIGYLVLFAPGGLGPREWIMAQMLMPFLAGVAPAMAILSRLWTIVIEIVATGLALTARK